MAAKFEFEEQKDVSSARVLLQQGLRANPCSKHLWIEVGIEVEKGCKSGQAVMKCSRSL